MSSHTTETQGTGQSVFAPRRDKCATSTSVWFAYVGTQAQSNGHSQGLVTQSQATGSDRKRVKPVSGVLSCNGPPSAWSCFSVRGWNRSEDAFFSNGWSHFDCT